MLFVIPDTHLGHENIKKYCNRPDGFENIIAENWNNEIGKFDTVIHLGDISMKSQIGDNYVKKLGKWNGKKVLVRGNHDKNSDEFYLNAGFTIVVEEIAMCLGNMKILFTHRPKLDHDADINIHGHQHNLSVLDETRLYLPLSIEHMGYKPLKIDENFLDGLKKFVIAKKQPTLKEIMALGQNAIGKPGDKDFYNGFGKKVFNESHERLLECYKILNAAPYTMKMQRHRLWRYALHYIEGKCSRKEFIENIRQVAGM